MEEEFEKKSTKKFLIPIIVFILIIGVGIAYYSIINTPQNIFIKAVDKIFETSEEKYDTLKTNLELSMNIESNNSEMQSIGQMASSVKLSTNQEIDLNNKIINEAISINFLGKDLLNLEYIIDEKTSYMFLKNLFSKYIEVPLEDIGYEDMFDSIKETEKITNENVLKELNKIINAELKNKKYEQTKEELMINGETINARKSTLVLTPEEANNMLASIITNIKDNDEIMGSFENKEEIKTTMQELIDDINESTLELVAENGEELRISIYTKGIKNEFARFDMDIVDNEETIGFHIIKVSENNYSISIVEDEEEIFYIDILDEKKDENSGTMTIKIDMSNVMKEAENGINTLAVILKAKYKIEYNAKVEIAEITDSVKYDEMTEEDINEIYENLQKTELYTLLEQSGMVDIPNVNEETDIEANMVQIETEPKVTLDSYTVKYDVPTGFSAATYNTEDYKYYFDENLNSAIIRIEKETKENYMDFLKEADALTSDLYENQEISGVKALSIGDKEISYRTITYTYNGINYTDTYYCYEIGEGHIYVVETSIEKGTVSVEELNKFLEIKLD